MRPAAHHQCALDPSRRKISSSYPSRTDAAARRCEPPTVSERRRNIFFLPTPPTPESSPKWNSGAAIATIRFSIRRHAPAQRLRPRVERTPRRRASMLHGILIAPMHTHIAEISRDRTAPARRFRTHASCIVRVEFRLHGGLTESRNDKGAPIGAPLSVPQDAGRVSGLRFRSTRRRRPGRAALPDPRRGCPA